MILLSPCCRENISFINMFQCVVWCQALYREVGLKGTVVYGRIRWLSTVNTGFLFIPVVDFFSFFFTPEALLMGQQCQAETFHGFIPCSLQSKTSLLTWTVAHASLCSPPFLVAWAWVSGGVYRNWCLDALECSFALNLIILVGTTYHVKFSQRNQLAVGYTSVSLALATFIGILVFQLANAFGITRYLKMKYTALTEAIRNQAEADVTSPPGSLPDRLINPEEYEPPHSTPHGHITSEPTEGPQKRLTPVYTYGSIN